MVSFSVLRMGSERASCDRDGEDIPSRLAKKCISKFLYEMELILVLQPLPACTE